MIKEKKKPLFTLKVSVQGEVYDRVYGIRDIQNIIDLFNEIHGNCMKIEIVEVEKEIKWS